MPRTDMSQPSLTASIRHLRAFLSVTRHRSFTRAALELRVSQPSLTMAIRQLEDIVGTSLLDRTTRMVSLTPEGRDFLPIVERLLSDFDMALDDVRAAATRRRGRIGVAMVHSITAKVMPFILKQFALENPQVRTQLKEGNSYDVRQRVRRNDVDVGFASKDDDDADLVFKFLYRDQMGILVQRDHALAMDSGPISWDRLENYEIIGTTEDTSTFPLLSEMKGLPHSVRRPKFEVSMNSMLTALLEAGIGMTIAPAASVFDVSGPLVFRPLTNPTTWRSIYVVTRRGRDLTRPARDLIALAEDRVRQMADNSALIRTSESS